MLLKVKRVVPQAYEIYYKGQNIISLIRPKPNDWRFSGFFMAGTRQGKRFVIGKRFRSEFPNKKTSAHRVRGHFCKI